MKPDDSWASVNLSISHTKFGNFASISSHTDIYTWTQAHVYMQIRQMYSAAMPTVATAGYADSWIAPCWASFPRSSRASWPRSYSRICISWTTQRCIWAHIIVCSWLTESVSTHPTLMYILGLMSLTHSLTHSLSSYAFTGHSFLLYLAVMYTDSVGSMQGAPGLDSRRKLGLAGVPLSGCGTCLDLGQPDVALNTNRGLATSAGVSFCKQPV